MRQVEVNGRSYRLPARQSVVVCDGCEPGLHRSSDGRRAYPWMKTVLAHGTSVIGLRRSDIHKSQLSRS
jgi:hypothetical protein